MNSPVTVCKKWVKVTKMETLDSTAETKIDFTPYTWRKLKYEGVLITNYVFLKSIYQYFISEKTIVLVLHPIELLFFFFLIFFDSLWTT